MSDVPPNNDCPSVELLSAYFDNETDRQGEIETHLKSCSSCRAYIDSLSEIDRSMKRTVRDKTGTDDKISGRILDDVHKALKNSELVSDDKKLLKPVLWRTAVLLIIGGFVGYLLWNEMQAEKEEDQKSDRIIQGSASVSAVLSKPTEKNKTNILLHSQMSTADKTAVPINYTVKHVWVIPAMTEKQISDFLAACSISEKTLKKVDNGWTMDFKAAKIQVIRFVRSCSEKGFRLQSPDQSQPAHTSFPGQADDIINYSASFVTNSVKQ